MELSYEEWQKALEIRYGAEILKKISQATVAICGLGGLGSNIALALARAGVGKLILIDFDTVDITNLHRQQYKVCQIGKDKTEALAENLLEIAPFLKIETHTKRITEDNAKHLLEKADAVCEAFDDAQAKAMLVEVVCEQMPNIFIVAASGMAGFDSANRIQTRKITKRFYLCGDEVSDVQHSVGLVSSRVMVCAAHQAHVTLKIITNQLEE